MLEKIVNISAGSDYKQSSKPGARSKASRYLSEYHQVGNDSISLSPATAFLSVIGWKLKKIQIDKEKIHIGFSFDNLDFSTVINPGELFQLQRIDYLIKYSLDSFTGMVEVNLKISSPLVSENSKSIQVKLHLTELKKFFNSIILSSGHKPLVSSDSYEVQNIFSEMEHLLQSEFHYINKSLIGFLEKFLSIKINTKHEKVILNNKLALNFLQIIEPGV